MDEYILVLFLISYFTIATFLGFRLLHIYSHPNDSKQCFYILTKGFILLGFILSWIILILLPIDVLYKISFKYAKYFNIFTLYRTAYWSSLLYIFILVPILIMSYLNIEGKSQKRYEKTKKSDTVKNTHIHVFLRILMFGVIFCSLSFCLLAISYLFFRKSELNITNQECKTLVQFIEKADTNHLSTFNIKEESECNHIEDQFVNVKVKLSFNDYIIMFLSFWGFFFFSLYCGVGLIYLPFNLIQYFLCRKKKISESSFKNTLSIINQRSKLLLHITELMQKEKDELNKMNPIKRFFKVLAYNREKNILNYAVHRLEQEYTHLTESYNNPKRKIIVIGSLFLGILFLIMSTSIIIHVIFYIILDYFQKPTTLEYVMNFMDTFFVYLAHHKLKVLSLIFYTILNSYLLFCALMGFIYFCTKVSFPVDLI